MDVFAKLDFDIKEILLAVKIPAGKGDAVHRNRPSHGLALHTAGDKFYYFDDGTTLNVKGGEIIFLPKGSNYEVRAEQPGDCYAVNFDFFEDKSLKPFVFRPKNLSALTEAFKAATRIWRAKLPSYKTGCKAKLFSIIHAIQNESFSSYVSGDKLSLIAPAVDYIHKNYTKELLSVNGLAKLCGITPEYFRSIFKSRFGTSPIKYINDLKITRAKELIGSGMYSVTEAAILSGFSDPSHFSREFKKNVGTSPIRYNQSI